MRGKLAPEIAKPLPVIVAALTVTGPVPVDGNVNGCVAGEFNATLPNETLVELMLSTGVPVAPVPLKSTTEVALSNALLATVK